MGNVVFWNHDSFYGLTVRIILLICFVSLEIVSIMNQFFFPVNMMWSNAAVWKNIVLGMFRYYLLVKDEAKMFKPQPKRAAYSDSVHSVKVLKRKISQTLHALSLLTCNRVTH